jgi:DNA primase
VAPFQELWQEISLILTTYKLEQYPEAATCAFGVHLTRTQLAQLSDRPDRILFIAFDSDRAGRDAASVLAQTLRNTALTVRIVELPTGHDPNSFFAAGASTEHEQGN